MGETTGTEPEVRAAAAEAHRSEAVYDLWIERFLRALFVAAALFFWYRGLSAFLQGETRIVEAGIEIRPSGGLAVAVGVSWCVAGVLSAILGCRRGWLTSGSTPPGPPARG